MNNWMPTLPNSLLLPVPEPYLIGKPAVGYRPPKFCYKNARESHGNLSGLIGRSLTRLPLRSARLNNFSRPG